MWIGYARISKADGSQILDLQRDALLEAGVSAEHIYEDQASGQLEDRPNLRACLKALRKGDVLVVWKLDRLGRDLRNLVNTVQDLADRGIGFKVFSGQGANLDTTSAGGKLVFGIFAALAEFERELIRERTRAGLAAARARGRKGGRKFSLTKAQVRLAQAAMGKKETRVSELCKAVPLCGAGWNASRLRSPRAECVKAGGLKATAPCSPMTVYVPLLGFTLFMSVPLYNLIVVNERVLFGPGMVYSVDRYMENLIRKSATRCYVFQLTVLISGLLLVHLEMGLSALFTQWVLAAKTVLLLALMGLLSYVHFGVQPGIEKLLAQVQGDPIPEAVASGIRPLRIRRKRLAGICLFLVVTTVMLGLQVFSTFHPLFTGARIALAALFAWRVYKSPVRFGWI